MKTFTKMLGALFDDMRKHIDTYEKDTREGKEVQWDLRGGFKVVKDSK